MTIEALTEKISKNLTDLGVGITVKKDQTLADGITYPVAIRIDTSAEDLLACGVDVYGDLLGRHDDGPAWADWYSYYTIVIGD